MKEEEEMRGSDDDEQEDPADYCKGTLLLKKDPWSLLGFFYHYQSDFKWCASQFVVLCPFSSFGDY